ncbi:MAG: ABC transporter permease [Deltaproteobacteria bacterium]|nr:ABC transporter permease [Deltaproteobacteria bacterium]
MRPDLLLQETVYNLRRNPGSTMLTIGTIAASLLLLGGYSLVVQNLYLMVGGVRTQAVVIAYLSDDADAELLRATSAKLPGVLEVRLVDKQEALQRLQSSIAKVQGLLDAVQGNPLPRSIEVIPKNTSKKSLETLSTSLSALPGVDEVDYGGSWLERLEALIKFMVYAGIIIGMAALFVSAFLVASTLRSSIYSRRDEIEVLKLVGASDSYVRAPFLVEGALEGIIGAGLALATLLLVYEAAAPKAKELLSLAFGKTDVFFLAPPIMFVLAAAGALLGITGSFLAIGSVLKKCQ